MKLKVIVFKGAERWVAQCLDFDIAAQARSIDDLPLALSRAILAEIETARQRGESAFHRLPAPPRKYLEMSGPPLRSEAWLRCLPRFVEDFEGLRVLGS